MLAKRIIPCLDVKDGQVVKGIKFQNHRLIGAIDQLATKYTLAGADELVFYDITASADNRVVDKKWVSVIANLIDIPFCVAGGISSLSQAQTILNYGADKISINSPALHNPALISDLAKVFGTQCVVVGIDSHFEQGQYFVYKYTGDVHKTINTKIKTLDWARQVEQHGAGEIVLNCMNHDGTKQGYALEHLQSIKAAVQIPVIASGGAGRPEHFLDLFNKTDIDGALAASVFHDDKIAIPKLKQYLATHNIHMRL